MASVPDAGPADAAPRVHQLKTDGWTVSWTPERAWADGNGQKGLTVYQGTPSTPECEIFFSGQVLSAFGSIVSYFEFEAADCGVHAAHPSEVRKYQAIDLRKLAKRAADPSASLFDAFDRAEVEKALAADTYLKNFQDAEFVCEYSLMGYDREWAVYDRKDGRVAVRLGLPHGCEVMRGQLTVLGLLLTPKPAAADAIERASAAGLLMRQLAPSGGESSEE